MEITGNIKFHNDRLENLLICSKEKALSLSEENKSIFIFLRFQQLIEQDEENYLVYLKNPNMETVMPFVCNKELWNNSLNINQITEPPFMLSGKIGVSSNKMVFKRLYISPISDMGIPVYTQEQKDLFNKLHEENKVFLLK